MSSAFQPKSEFLRRFIDRGFLHQCTAIEELDREALKGGLVAYIAATAVMALLLAWPGRLRHALAVNRESAKWFTLSGVLVFLSQMFLYMAMSVAPVTVVSLAGALALSLSTQAVQDVVPLPGPLVALLAWHWP